MQVFCNTSSDFHLEKTANTKPTQKGSDITLKKSCFPFARTIKKFSNFL